jgi:hypothetical protein
LKAERIEKKKTGKARGLVFSGLSHPQAIKMTRCQIKVRGSRAPAFPITDSVFAESENFKEEIPGRPEGRSGTKGGIRFEKKVWGVNLSKHTDLYCKHHANI